jgi:hypothetical protein
MQMTRAGVSATSLRHAQALIDHAQAVFRSTLDDPSKTP